MNELPTDGFEVIGRVELKSSPETAKMEAGETQPEAGQGPAVWFSSASGTQLPSPSRAIDRAPRNSGEARSLFNSLYSGTVSKPGAVALLRSSMEAAGGPPETVAGEEPFDEAWVLSCMERRKHREEATRTRLGRPGSAACGAGPCEVTPVRKGATSLRRVVGGAQCGAASRNQCGKVSASQSWGWPF
uniref:Uncharacterized protein n=1 Tax=Chromera velia CCMP2878 TaxID=1169474 RepID=A0A0G4FA84_9ALVE|eukprot:Cvel_15835.t1-p1 / transcript=Cvel_15835.t1 / gene=Cvel_15835 / organism=Chromera_velia_CCMP2878 / gene_product=hypothetical protein / transcript_product=hypothetical protein / location=Cvel_scaffold1190:22831-23923(-) / protein_length=187 / sequence_SO=supercontig / SO=protein_coding / is_pseudo=false